MGLGGTGTDASQKGLLTLDASRHDLESIFRSGDVERDYEVQRDPIARGKFASVRVARHRITNEVFAAKFVRRRRSAANLEKEARHEIAVLLLGRNTPYIAHLHQVYETRSEFIIILEFGEGGDLQRILDDQGSLPEKSVRDLLRQVLRGLKFLHQKFIAHLDIKPQNLVLMGSRLEDGVKLVDFGLSRVIDKNAELTQIMGTPDYVAPEIINYEPVGFATDMWSIGVLTYVLLTGYTPFGGDTDQETFVNITQAEFDFPDEYFGGVSDTAKDFISALLIKSPNRRMSVDQTLAHPWLCDLLEPHRLSQLSEADSADSGYSTDLCSSSPPSPETLSTGFPTDVCQFAIPEELMPSHLPHRSSFRSSFKAEPRVSLSGRSSEPSSVQRRHKLSSAHLSINVLDCLKNAGSRNSFRQVRGSSVILPRFYKQSDDQEDLKSENLMILNCDDDFNPNYRLNQNYYNSGPADVLESIPNYKCNSPFENKPRNNKRTFESNDGCYVNQRWNDLCHGDYNRTSNNQIKSPRKTKSKSNLGTKPELSCSMFELNPNYETQRTSATVGKLRPHKKESRSSNSRQDLRLNADLDKYSSPSKVAPRRTQVSHSHLDLNSPLSNSSNLKNHDLRSCQSEIRLPHRNSINAADKKATNSGSSRRPLFQSQNFSSIPCLNSSLSHLDISYETAEENETSEARDVVPGDCTLPRRFSRTHGSNLSNMLSGNSFHMSFRRPKKRENKIWK